MAAKRGATFRRRELGKELRKFREMKGETLQETAKALGGASPRTVDTVCYAAAASVTDRCSKATGLIWPSAECLLLVL